MQASPGRVFQALTDEIDIWWSYRIVADPRMYLEPHIGGRFYEAFNGGGGAFYAFVTYLKPREEIRLKGSMGLADEGANNVIHMDLKSLKPETTLLGFSHRFLGRVNVITVDTFNRSWVELLKQHLKSYVELGTRYQVPI